MVVEYEISTPFVTPHAILGEGPAYVPSTNELYFVDVIQKQLKSVALIPETEELRLSPSVTHPEAPPVEVFAPSIEYIHTTQFKEPVTVLALTPSSPKEFLVGAQHGFAIARPGDENLEYKVNVYKHDADKHDRLRFNDGNVDPSGRFLAGTMINNLEHDGIEDIGTLFALELDGSVRSLFDGCSIPNGLQFSDDGTTMFHSDSPTKTVWVYDYDVDTGVASNKRALFEVDGDGAVPDGLTISAQGDLFVAIWGGHRVEQRDSLTGQLKAIFKFPARNVTCPTFGGKDLDSLFVTTASLEEADRNAWSEKESHYDLGGEVFRFKVPGHVGVPRGIYKGTL
ncbi:hypothetical protein V1514DRAFT_338871 [Lipomyces japonicus]|uniref:uncharacterized protein n=1 Tax=Lipomyces japonicus TaxID=56871 RepID=UPI0034D00E93